MIDEREERYFEADLNSFDAAVRSNAVAELYELCRTRKVRLSEASDAHNLHCHTFFSYNGYGFSPSQVAWLAKKYGWYAVGIIDFDVLDGVDEFLHATGMFDLRATAGMETRVFIPEMADVEINSPGEPGVAYHLGIGFSSERIPEEMFQFALALKTKAAERTRRIVELVNPYLSAIAIDFDVDAVRLTPKGNVTERHVCEAYRRKAESVFPVREERARYLSEHLGTKYEDTLALLDNPARLEAAIRAKTMKKGGVGYIPADPASFPTLSEMNRFVSACGAIPCVAWLNGISSGETNVDALLKLHKEAGAAMLNIIPDRNWNFPVPEQSERMAAEMDRVIAAARALQMPVIVGTEMNAPGMKMVDDFDVPALSKHMPKFLQGADIAYAHTLLSEVGKGLLSDWAKAQFKDVKLRNAWYAWFGAQVLPTEFAKMKPKFPETAEAIAELVEENKRNVR